MRVRHASGAHLDESIQNWVAIPSMTVNTVKLESTAKRTAKVVRIVKEGYIKIKLVNLTVQSAWRENMPTMPVKLFVRRAQQVVMGRFAVRFI